MASAPKLFVSAKGDIIIDGNCSSCNKPLLSKIKTSKRIDWKEYAMVVRDARVCYAARSLGNHKSDRKQDVPKSNPHQTEQSIDHHPVSLL